MGNKLATPQGHLDIILHDIPGIVVQTKLKSRQLFVTLQCLHDEGLVVAKVHMKRPGADLSDQVRRMKEISENFRVIPRPNIYGVYRIVETDKAGYLVRPYFKYNLYERIGTRPFLTPIEKKWIAFQLLKALSQCHFVGICHGDVKCENLMITSWNWLYLTDFACFKPTFIPENE